ncbi:hypothetical protein JZ751_027717 [Albula glossodonta]|uniref:Uncharacterized protein n=1 Tax=Albula glossodonta TaxID=121402 RepID=A0A8T2P9G5_9TELE|nr:hypothetical protein JZ751_027717 [Albula glossodonta]
MAASGEQKVPKSEKLDEAQALAKSCAGRPDFLPMQHSQFQYHHDLRWTIGLKVLTWGVQPQALLRMKEQASERVERGYSGVGQLVGESDGWPQLRQTPGKYVYQPMTSVCQLPSTPVPAAPSDYTDTIDLSISLTERFLRIAPSFLPPPYPESPKFCVISDLFIDDYIVKRINGKMCYVQRPPPPLPAAPPAQLPPQHPSSQTTRGVQCRYKGATPAPGDSKANGPKIDHCTSPSSSEDSGINALGLHYLESCDEDSEEEEEDEELSSDGDSSPGSLWDQDECSLLSPSKSTVEIIEKIETTSDSPGLTGASPLASKNGCDSEGHLEAVFRAVIKNGEPKITCSQLEVSTGTGGLATYQGAEFHLQQRHHGNTAPFSSHGPEAAALLGLIKNALPQRAC